MFKLFKRDNKINKYEAYALGYNLGQNAIALDFVDILRKKQRSEKTNQSTNITLVQK